MVRAAAPVLVMMTFWTEVVALSAVEMNDSDVAERASAG